MKPFTEIRTKDVTTETAVTGNEQVEIPACPQTNACATISLIAALTGLFLIAIVFGHIALSQLDESDERGQGIALTGTIIGWVEAGIVIVVAAVSIFVMSR